MKLKSNEEYKAGHFDGLEEALEIVYKHFGKPITKNKKCKSALVMKQIYKAMNSDYTDLMKNDEDIK